jgi:hypothetical protein
MTKKKRRKIHQKRMTPPNTVRMTILDVPPPKIAMGTSIVAMARSN